MKTNATVKQMADLIVGSNSFIVTVHESPDGDAVGSMLALNGMLKLMGKSSLMYSPDVIPTKLRFLKGWDEIIIKNQPLDGKNFDVMVMLDCGDRARSGNYITKFNGYKKLINIDHHVSNNAFGDLNYIDPKVSSTAEHVYELVKELVARNRMDKIPADVATDLLAALYDDTGGMRYISTTSKTLNIAADLVDSGANCSYVSENLFFSVSRERMELAGRVLSTLTFEKDDKLAYMVMKISDLEVTGAFSEDSEGLIDFPRSIYGVEVAFLIKEVAKDKYKLSFRSRGKVDVNEFCSRFGGGGHKVAAGCTIKGSLDEVTSKVVSQLAELL
ncbi:MAG: bifunctional oligoribonuclease/PAP phosphatase NrnA [Proteobacteria bacterium]|nr:bifunctional oligoribonuclease/PAP phosphatase NrnA [Pseudomonadota bacterium]